MRTIEKRIRRLEGAAGVVPAADALLGVQYVGAIIGRHITDEGTRRAILEDVAVRCGLAAVPDVDDVDEDAGTIALAELDAFAAAVRGALRDSGPDAAALAAIDAELRVGRP